MTGQQKDIAINLFTSQGPVFMRFSIEGYSKFLKMLYAILEDVEKVTPIPEVFLHAFSEGEEKDA